MKGERRRKWTGFAPAILPALLLMLAGFACSEAPVDRTDGHVEPAALAAPPDTAFSALIESLSGPGGYFDTDNLISNERSYLHVLGVLENLDLEGGAYIGVGPDQNFSYIARLRPRIAFIVDIRRDNLLQHLFFKALFAQAANRIEYLCLLFGRPAPPDADGWGDRPLENLIAYLDATPARDAGTVEDQVWSQIQSFGVPLSPADRAVVRHIHASFIENGLDLKFTSLNRAPRSYYPTYRDLLLETDRAGQPGNYLVREADYRFVKTLQDANRVVPVVGDLAGEYALPAIGRWLEEQGEVLTAFYTSNVEFYLMRNRTFDRFVENVAHLPRADEAVLVRSFFNYYSYPHPQTVPGYASTQLIQYVHTLVDEYERGGYRSYGDLIYKHVLETP